MQLFNDLKTALEHNELELYYQPQISMRDESLVGAEALLRWNHPDRGQIQPSEFISIAESGGLMIDIGTWVIDTAFAQAEKWQKDGYKPFTMAVNISAMQFKRDNLFETITAALDRTGLAPHYVELELTESILIQDTETVLKDVKRFKKMGIKLSVDDFGTGYSSLSYLKRFAVDKLKIDQSFVTDLSSSNEDVAIIDAIIQMAKRLNLKTIAEGIESESVLDLLREHGCDEAQGFFYSKPIPSKEFARFLSKK